MSMKLTVWPYSRSDASYEYTFDGDEVLVGRGNTCHVRLPFPFVSSHHFTVVSEGSAYLVADSGSTNGTAVNGKRVAPHAFTAVRDRDLIAVGDIMMQVSLSTDAPGDTRLRADEHARAMVWQALASKKIKGASMEVVAGPDRGESLLLPEGVGLYTVGSASDASLVLSDPEAEGCLFTVEHRGDGFYVLTEPDVAVRVMIDGAPLAETLHMGREHTVTVGQTELRFQDPLQAYLEQLARLPEEKTVGEFTEDFLSTQQIDTVRYEEQEQAPPELGPPDRPPVPGQLKLASEADSSGPHKRVSERRWGAFEYVVVVVAVAIVVGGVLAALVLLNVV